MKKVLSSVPGCVFPTAFCPIAPPTTACILTDTLLLEVGSCGPWQAVEAVAREFNPMDKDETTGGSPP